MSTVMHVGKMFRAFDWNRGEGHPKRWFQIDSWSDRVLITLGRNPDEEEPKDAIGITLDGQEALEVFQAFRNAMNRAGYRV